MRKRIMILIIAMIILIIPSVSTLNLDCEISLDNVSFGNINTTYWGGCIDQTNDAAYIQNLDCDTTYYLRCQNQIHSFGYATIITEDCGESEPMASLAITIFILLITGGIFALSMKEDIFKNKYPNLIAKRALLVLSIYLMILNSAIMATIAVDAGIALEQEMFFYMNLFGYIGYPAIILLIVSAIFQSLNEIKKDKKKKRMGEEDE